jgi:hypothetical protein
MEGKMGRIRFTCVQLIMLLFLMIPTSGYGGSAEEFLILQDIGGYRNMGKGGGLGSGILAATGHFNKDHADESYSTMYYSDVSELGLNVQVTRHAGVDSDQWLLHEVEYSYRDPEDNTLGLAIQGVRIRNFNGDNIIALRGNSYSWISNNTVIIISYTDLDGTKPEPLEVVQAYLQKYPSTLPEGFVFDAAHNEQWIKDEMSRRLWLSEKWFAWQAGGNVEMVEALGEVVDHLEEFLDYRQRYFGMNANQEKMDLIAANRSNDEVAMKAKVAQYKQWWNSHKGDPIPLP